MKMKKKIRLAFEHATPNVLERILQEAAPLRDDAEAAAPARHIPHWVTEFAATAAALVLLLGVIGGAVWFVQSNDFPEGPHGMSSNPTGTSGSILTSRDARDAALAYLELDPTEDLMMIRYLKVEWLSESEGTWSVVLGFDANRHTVQIDASGQVVSYDSSLHSLPPDIALSSVIDWKRVCDIAMEYSSVTLEELIGFEYEFDLNEMIYTVQLQSTQSAATHLVQIHAQSGEVLNGTFVAEVITREQAQTLAQQTFRDDSIVESVKLVMQDGGIYYIVTLNGATAEWYAVCYVNAVTGEVLNTTTPADLT